MGRFSLMLEVELIKLAKRHFVENERQTLRNNSQISVFRQLRR